MIPEGFLIEKLAPALGGLFGGLSLAMFWTPEKLQEKGKVASVFIAGGISAMAGFAFTGLVAEKLSISSDKLDMLIGLAWILGLCSIAIINWVSNYMVKREHMDIGEVAEEIKHKKSQEMTLIHWLMSILVIELIAVLTVAFLAFSGFFTDMRMLSKIGIFVMTTGLMVQVMRSLHYFEYGAYPVDTLFPLWITKDIGASIIIFDLALLHFRKGR